MQVIIVLFCFICAAIPGKKGVSTICQICLDICLIKLMHSLILEEGKVIYGEGKRDLWGSGEDYLCIYASMKHIYTVFTCSMLYDM